MSKGINRILDFMKLNDNEYENDYDEFEEEEEPEQEVPVRNVSRKNKQSRKAKKASARPQTTSYEELDDIPDDIPEDNYARRSSGRQRKSNKIVQMNSAARSSAMEVCVTKPIDFESCQEISDIILENKAAIINFESVTTEDAQRIIDFVSGSCYAIDGTVKQVSENIVVVTPNDIDISGDFQDADGAHVEVPSFSDPYLDDEE